MITLFASSLKGFLFYYVDYNERTDSVPSSLVKLSKLIDIYAGTERKLDLNVDAYNISKEAIHFEDDDYFQSSERNNYYDFCIIDGTPCSVLSIYTASNDKRHGVSKDYYQIPHGHCNNTMTLSPEAQEKMELPPIPLTENYLECRRTLQDTLFTSVGIAVGNVLSVKSGLVLFFTFLLARFTTNKKKAGGKSRVKFSTYGQVERDKVLQYLAFNLLLARDRKYPSDVNSPLKNRNHFDAEQGHKSGHSSSSLVIKLAKELETHPNIKRFFPVDGAKEGLENDNDVTLPQAQQQYGSRGCIELTATSSVTSPSTTSDTSSASARSNTLCSNLSASCQRRNEQTFQEEVLSNPMFVKDNS